MNPAGALTSDPSFRPMGIRFVAYMALLFASWNHNLLGLPDGMFWSRAELRVGYLGSESHLVISRLAHPDIHPLYPLTGQTAEGGFVPYPSQVGLTGIALSAARNITGAPSERFVEIAGAIYALLTAAMVAGVLATAHRWLGPPTGDVACAVLASVPIFLLFAPSLYWVTWALLAPFTLVWCAYPWANTPRRRAGLVAAVAVAVLVKSLCGYEYITTVILAPVAAAWFHQHRTAEPLFLRARFSCVLVGAGLLGFALAMGLHVAQQEVILGQDGIAVIRSRAVARTAGNPEAESHLGAGALSEGRGYLPFAVGCFLDYFEQRAVSVAGGFGRVRKDIPLLAVAGFGTTFAVASWAFRRRWRLEGVALGGAVIVGLGASISWQVLAVNHMCVHRHLNLIVYCVPFLPLVALAAGYSLRLVGGQRLGPVILGGVAVTMAMNVVTDQGRRSAEGADQAAAEAIVANRLTGQVPSPGDGLGGSVDQVQTEASVHPSLLNDYGQLDPITGNPTDPGALVISGWALGDARPSTRPTTRIVVAVGGAVVRCESLRFRRPDVERLLGRPAPGTGYVVVVPSTALRPGERIRVFVVPTAEPARLAELVIKRE